MRSFSVGLISVGLLGVLSISLAAQTRATVGGLTPAQQAAFNEGSRTFSKNYGVADGLGPVFNDESCNDCHRKGGGSNDTVTRFGRLDSRGVFDSLPELGGSLIQSRGIGSTPSGDVTHVYAGERTPSAATVTALRRSHALQGLGFVDAVPDETWQAIARAEAESDPASAGRVHVVMQLSREMRTQPLWGLRNTNRFLHDASSRSLEDAISRHDGQGRAARDRFAALPPDQVARVLAFLRSL